MDDRDIDIPPYASPRLRARGVDRETRRLAIIAGGIGLAIIVLALIWSGVHTGLGPPPVVKPPAGPMRTLPKNPGGLQVPGAHEQIMSGQTTSGPPQLVPSPPPPDFSGLDQPPAAPTQTAPAPSQQAVVGPTAPSTLPLPPPAPDTPATPGAITPPAPQTSAALPAITPPTEAKSAGTYSVQLGALTSMAKADQAWQTLVARIPDILGGKQPVVVAGVVRRVTFYRLRLGGFASADAAGKFCDRLKERGVKCYIPK